MIFHACVRIGSSPCQWRKTLRYKTQKENTSGIYIHVHNFSEVLLRAPIAQYVASTIPAILFVTIHSEKESCKISRRFSANLECLLFRGNFI